MKLGCSMQIKFTFIHGRPFTKPMDPVKVTKVNYEHTNGCEPSCNQVFMCRKQSGEYSKLNKELLCSVIAMLQIDHGVSQAPFMPCFASTSQTASQSLFGVRC